MSNVSGYRFEMYTMNNQNTKVESDRLLKSLISVVQRDAAPKNVVEFR